MELLLSGLVIPIPASMIGMLAVLGCVGIRPALPKGGLCEEPCGLAVKGRCGESLHEESVRCGDAIDRGVRGDRGDTKVPEATATSVGEGAGIGNCPGPPAYLMPILRIPGAISSPPELWLCAALKY